jgi:hypothetical protein
MTAAKKFMQRLQVALAMGVSVATCVLTGVAWSGESMPLSCAAGLSGMLSFACWLMCD